MARNSRKPIVSISGLPTSTAYAKVNAGEQALMAGMLWPYTPQPNSDDLDAGMSWNEFVERIINRLAHGDSTSTITADLGLEVALATGSPLSPDLIEKQLKVVSHLPISHKFSRNNPQHIAIPRPPHVHAVRAMVSLIAGDIRKFAERKPDFVRDRVCFYASHVQTDNILIFRKEADVRELEDFICFLKKLREEPRVYGFGSYNATALRLKLTSIGLRPRTPIFPRPAHNNKSRAAENHLGLGVVCQLSDTSDKISSEAFRYAMALSVIAQVWKFGETLQKSNVLSSPQNPEANSQCAFSFPNLEESPE